MSYLGDYTEDYATLNFKFTTRAFATGVPTTLAGTPVVKCYKGSATGTESTAGITLSVDFDSVTGLNNVLIDLSADAFYAVGQDYHVIITTGTVGGTSVVGETVATFSIENRFDEVDVTAIGGDAQSATDLKDFADAGYDPATNKVQGVVLVDSNADLVSAASTASAVWTTDFSLAYTANDAAQRVKNIETDTGTTIPTTLGTPTDTDLATDIANVSTQISGLGASSGAAISFPISEDNTGGSIKGISFVGTQTGTFANTEQEDGTYHQIDHSGNAIDIVYGADIGGSRVGVEVTFHGYLNSSNDQIQIFAYDFVGAGWDLLKTVTGQNGATNVTEVIALFTKYTGTGADAGKVYIRFEESGMTAPVLFVDQLIVGAVSSSATIGYVNGAVWIDTALSNTGTESFVDGTADNPVSTLAAATTIASNLNLKMFHSLPGTSLTLAQTYDNYEFRGKNFTLALGGQSIAGVFVDFATTISGIGTGTNGTTYTLQYCSIGTATLDCYGFIHQCAFASTVTLANTSGVSSDFMSLLSCYSGVAGSGSPTIDASALTKTTFLQVREWFGGLTLSINSFVTATVENTVGGTLTLTNASGALEVRGSPKAVALTTTGSAVTNVVISNGCPVTVAGTGGTVNVYGNYGALTDSSSGTTINEFRGQIIASSLGAQAKLDVNTEADTALSDIHLDHLLATTYDATSKPGASGALLNEMVEDDSGVTRYTANALEQAPGGGGGSNVYQVVVTADLTGSTLNYVAHLEENGQQVGTVSAPSVAIFDKDDGAVSFTTTPTVENTNVVKGSGTFSPTDNVPYAIEVAMTYSGTPYVGRVYMGKKS